MGPVQCRKFPGNALFLAWYFSRVLPAVKVFTKTKMAALGTV
jgi:hypothetical protein